jgi:hypothetical protein
MIYRKSLSEIFLQAFILAGFRFTVSEPVQYLFVIVLFGRFLAFLGKNPQ